MRLQLTKRADYGIRAMLALARARDERMSAPRIAAAMRIPRHFLPQVMADLARAGLVKSTAGRHGGYRLARPADVTADASSTSSSPTPARRCWHAWPRPAWPTCHRSRWASEPGTALRGRGGGGAGG